jgi:hypothetical protein
MGWFPVHPLLQSLGIGCFTYGAYLIVGTRSISPPQYFFIGILTLQPTAQPKTKAAGLRRHQRTMLAVGFPCIALGTLAIEIQKFIGGHDHFATWHGVGSCLYSISGFPDDLATDFRICFRRVARGTSDPWRRKCVVWRCSVWWRYEGQKVVEIPQVTWVIRGMSAKIANTFRRLSGYVLFPLLLITAHLGGAWSTWVTSHSQPVVRFVGYTLAPIVAIFAIYARVRLVVDSTVSGVRLF